MMEKLMESERSESERPRSRWSQSLWGPNPSDPNKSAGAPATLDPALRRRGQTTCPGCRTSTIG